MIATLRRHPDRFARLVRVVAVVFTFGALAAAAALPADRVYLLVYMAPVIPAGAWWLHLRLARLEVLPDGALALDAGVFGAAALRTFGGFGVIPWSGHLLFLTYSFATTADRRYRTLAALLWVVATITKLRYRDDPGAWALGCLLGLALAPLATHLHRAGAPA